MTKQIITFTMSLKQSQFEVDRLEIEAKKMGVEVNRALYRNLEFRISNLKTQVFVKGVEVTPENCMGMWFRVAGTVSGKYTEGRNLAIRILQSRIMCVNHEGYLNWTRMGKISQHALFLEKNIPIVPTMVFYTKDQITNPSPTVVGAPLDRGADNFFGWDYPIIAKHEKGYQGKSVKKFDNWKQVERFLGRINEKNLGMFLWQKCLPTRWDLRVIVLDGKAIGAMKRSAVGDEFRSNFSLGGAVEPWNLSPEDRKLAENVAKVCGLDYCGVDIMKGPNPSVPWTSPLDRGEYSYVLEVNRQCQFQGFEKATGINVAKLVVEMFLKKNGGQ